MRTSALALEYVVCHHVQERRVNLEIDRAERLLDECLAMARATGHSVLASEIDDFLKGGSPYRNVPASAGGP